MTDISNTFGNNFGEQFGATTLHTQQLIDDCLRSTGIEITNTLYRARALSFLNFAYLAALQGKQWSFTNREMAIEMTKPYESGTVALTQDSSTVDEDVDSDNDAVPVIQWTAGVVGQLFIPNDTDAGHYRIHQLPNTKQLKLVSDYTGDSASFSTYKILFDRYSLTAHVQEIKEIAISTHGPIELVSVAEMQQKKQSDPSRTGAPRYASIYEVEADSGQVHIEVYPSPDKRYTMTIAYSLRPVTLDDSETSFPLIPPEHRVVLAYGVMEQIYILQNNAQMAAAMGRKHAMAMSKFTADHKISDPNPRIQHGRKYFNRGSRRYKGYYGLKWFGKVDD